MLFEYFGEHIVQPCRDLFEKATRMKVSQSSDTRFLTQVEATAAMETCGQIELFQPHADAASRHNGSSSERPKDKKSKGGKGKGGGKVFPFATSNLPQQRHSDDLRRHLRRHPRRARLTSKVPFSRPAKVKAKAKVARGKASLGFHPNCPAYSPIPTA